MDALNPQVSGIAQLIQLALAPIFLLSGVGIILTVLTNRLARVVDRARKLEDAMRSEVGGDTRANHEYLVVLARRARLINRAITMSTICALLVAVVVATLFLNEFMAIDLSTTIAIIFILAMLCLIIALLFFLREVYIAVRSLRIGTVG